MPRSTPTKNRPHILSSAHLASPGAEELSEFEYGLTVAANGFNRWIVHCMKAAGVPVSPARFRECLNQWAGKGKKTGKSRNNHRNARNGTNARPTTPASQVTPAKSAFAAGQTGFRVKDL